MEQNLESVVVDATALKQQVGGDHYKGMKIQPVEFIHANDIPFIEGCVVKYVCRWRSKGGIADLKKAQHFIDLLIALEAKTDREEAQLTPSRARMQWDEQHRTP